MFSTFGHLFRITTFGESHGGGVGVVIDGCPPGVDIDMEAVQAELSRRKPGQSILTTPRQEEDLVQVLSGMFEGKTLGTPIAMLVHNKDARPSSYEKFKDIYRPSHADYTYQAKYGIRNWMGGGRASARETIGRVAGGAVALQVMRESFPLEVVAWVESVHQVDASDCIEPAKVSRDQVEQNAVRCPHPEKADEMYRAIDEARRDRDSLGGVVACVVRGAPAGLGEPVFSKLEAELGRAMMSLPAVKGFEIGSGFAGTLMRGSEHNDPFRMKDGAVSTTTNHSGGVQGGISNGEDIFFRVAFKPTATIGKVQQTVNEQGDEVDLEARGRHDPCVLPRAVPIVEAMTNLVLVDAFLIQRARRISD
ncbi:MAG: chorismate synthase [Candidatus Eremiobacteraeota bacterium]|nr:chorismate synthase [Candidatus Eremiobacteraeota bacterium]